MRDAYSIDATEVTNASYSAFLAADPATANQPPECRWNGTFVPSNDWPAFGNEAYPVVWVDWCDARAYCAWAGKRLCGSVAGGPTPFGETNDPQQSQWYDACSLNASRMYPYGNDYDADACNGEDYGAGAALAAGSLETCQGGQAGLYDMSGNVWEWEDSCSEAVGETDKCHARGGSFFTKASIMRCSFATTTYNRTQVGKNIGFRCCRD